MPRRITGLAAAVRAEGLTPGHWMPVSMIRWRMGHVHVGTPDLAVAREFWHRRAKGLPRPIKRAIVRVALAEHRANRRLYRDVMSGRF